MDFTGYRLRGRAEIDTEVQWLSLFTYLSVSFINDVLGEQREREHGGHVAASFFLPWGGEKMEMEGMRERGKEGRREGGVVRRSKGGAEEDNIIACGLRQIRPRA